MESFQRRLVGFNSRFGVVVKPTMAIERPWVDVRAVDVDGRGRDGRRHGARHDANIGVPVPESTMSQPKFECKQIRSRQVHSGLRRQLLRPAQVLSGHPPHFLNRLSVPYRQHRPLLWLGAYLGYSHRPSAVF